MPRPLSLLFAATVIAGGAPGVARADVSPLLYDRLFDVSVTATSSSQYEVPRHYGYATCYRKEWHEASASETWTFQSKGKTRLGAVASTNAITFIRLKGTGVEGGVPARGTITRASRSQTGADPGDCGGGAPTTEWTGSDCGSRAVLYDVVPQIVLGRLSVKPLAARDASPDQALFKDCLLPTAKGAGDGGWDALEERIRVRKLLQSKQTTTVKASRTFREDVIGTKGWMETTTSWTVTFKPVPKRSSKPSIKRRR